MMKEINTLCPICKGRGYVKKLLGFFKFYNVCGVCLGKGKVDWIQNIKKENVIISIQKLIAINMSREDIIIKNYCFALPLLKPHRVENILYTSYFFRFDELLIQLAEEDKIRVYNITSDYEIFRKELEYLGIKEGNE